MIKIKITSYSENFENILATAKGETGAFYVRYVFGNHPSFYVLNDNRSVIAKFTRYEEARNAAQLLAS